MMAGPHVFFKMMLSDLLYGIQDLDPQADRSVTGLSLDSREIRDGDVFLACIGLNVDGADYIDAAIERGAVAVLWEAPADASAIALTYRHGGDGRRVPVIAVKELAAQLGFIAHRFYAQPSAAMFTVGVTGTNGKTSVSQYLAHSLAVDAPCGVIGTLGHGLYRAQQPSNHTTPDAVTLHRWLAELREEGSASVSMEVSSHALHQGRINGVQFDCAVFTNLSRDHLDYHGDMHSYAEVKSRLFRQPGLRYAVLNSDDAYARQLFSALPDSLHTWRYGLDAQYQPEVLGGTLSLSSQGLTLEVVTPLGKGRIQSSLLGRFNASNLLAVLSVLLLRGIPLKGALARLETVTPVAGRMQTLGGNGLPLVVVDYAHTPDALQQALQALREHADGRVCCVFGCGGDRDKGKRPLMGRIAEQLADSLIITNDNPRNENPEDIIEAIQQGMENPLAALVEPDRRAAIHQAIQRAAPEDVVLVAGKGHETWQQIGTQKYPFSDAAEVKAGLESGS